MFQMIGGKGAGYCFPIYSQVTSDIKIKKGNEFMLVIVPGVDAALPQGWAPSPQGRLVSANREGSHHPQRSGSLSLAKHKRTLKKCLSIHVNIYPKFL